MNKAIVLDVDCVLLDFYKGFEVQASNALGRPLREAGNIYNLINRYNLKDYELKHVFQYMMNKFDDFPLLEGADLAFKSLREAGFNIHLVTSIKPELSEQRLSNLLKYGLEPDTIDCVYKDSKQKYIEKYNPIAMVDDRIENLYNLKETVSHRVLINNGDDQTGFEHFREHITHESHSLNHWIVSNPHILSPERKRLRMK